MAETNSIQFVVPRDEAPSYLRRLSRRTLYLRLLDGEFILFCFETGQCAHHTSELLSDKRVIVSDTQAFVEVLRKAMVEVGGASVPRWGRVLIFHCLRFASDSPSRTETYSFYEMWKSLGR